MEDNKTFAFGQAIDVSGVSTGGNTPLVTLPEGDYNFTVRKAEKGDFAGSDKMPACPQLIIGMTVDGGELGTGYCTARLYLCSQGLKKLKAFYVSIGVIKKDDKQLIPTIDIIGKTGNASFGTHAHEGKEYMDVKYFNEPKAKPEPAAKSAKPAVFDEDTPF